MTGLIGIIVLLAIAYLFSNNAKAIRWRTVVGALVLQFGIGFFVLVTPIGKDILYGISQGVANVISYSQEGINFIFGRLADANQGFIFGVHVLTVIIFFSSLIAVLYYLQIMQWVIRIIGGALQKILGVSRPEAMSATANIFVGQTEAPLVVKPFIPNMTRSELFAVMVGGLSTVAGAILAGYANLGIELKYLIAASFMAAPGGLLMAKMIQPETETPNEDVSDLKQSHQYTNIFDAAASGASNGMQLAINVGAMLLAFVSLIALINALLSWSGAWFGLPDLSLQWILGYLFQPIAFIIGVPWAEAQQAGSFIGQKLIVNEFVAYLDFLQYKEQLTPVTQIIITFALCGFANLSSIAILLGGIGGMAPNRRPDIAALGLKAVLAGTLANLMSAAIAGLLFLL